MTEQEARQTWCPKALAPFGVTTRVAANRSEGGDPLPGTNCIASRCQWWVADGEDDGRCGAINLPAAP